MRYSVNKQVPSMILEDKLVFIEYFTNMPTGEESLGLLRNINGVISEDVIHPYTYVTAE